MPEYVLYLDESETQSSDNKKYFCIAGIIVEKKYHDNELTTQLNKSKQRIWYEETNNCINYILHEQEINEAHDKHFANIEKYNHMFCNNSCYNRVYNEMSYIFSDKNISIIGASLCVDDICGYYGGKDVSNNKFTICMQLIIENYCHFLINHNSTGTICYEALQTKQNGVIKKRYNQIGQMGTMFYSNKIICEHIKGLYFEDKKKNIAGLQIADFVPNELARKHAGMKPKFTKTHKAIIGRLYDGLQGRKDRFGHKKIS